MGFTALLPEWVKKPMRRVRAVVKGVPYYGKGRWCPVCGKSSRLFRSFGAVPRQDAQCVHCDALERHRLLWLYLNKHTDLFDGKPKKVLHVAPELCFEPRFKQRLGDSYITADLFNPRAMVSMDITDIQYPDESFDVIYCSHVLEHVHDDKRAMREFCRVLKTTGWAILLVPITSDVTFEDPTITDPQERLKAFGQEDHVRRYGPDYVSRLEEAGFNVKTTTIEELASEQDIITMGLTPASGEIYYCTKK
ncbi:class I SAM-dependent methyltransferase [Rheinheimera metallidurans]|uniref:class I SAM-dependent methyltransferase n=1 Tax=Rheinheimera metallidurans TaxID=2925781 RepID=UPI003001240C